MFILISQFGGYKTNGKKDSDLRKNKRIKHKRKAKLKKSITPQFSFIDRQNSYVDEYEN